MEQNHQSIEAFCEQIRQDAKKEIDKIISRATRTAKEKLDVAQKEVERIRENILKQTEEEAENIKRRVMADVNLEIKKVRLKSREEIIDEVLARVKEKLQALRTTDAYRDVLKKLIVQGILALDENEVAVKIASEDVKLASGSLLSEVKNYLQDKYKRSVTIEFSQAPLQEGIGVCVYSKKGNIFFDNTFNARMKRMDDELRLAISREIFSEE